MIHAPTRSAQGIVLLALVGSVSACGVAPEMDGSVEAGLDVTSPDVSSDLVVVDRSARDSEGDARADVVTDALPDAASTDVSAIDDASPDVETVRDSAPDSLADSASDAVADSAPDAVADSAPDAVVDTGVGCVAPSRVCSGSCVDVTSSALHCGACGNACAVGRVCSASACVCGSGTKLCGTSCVSSSNPATGCGAASCAACSVPNATASCTAGACSVGACAAGFGDCNASATDGCETNTNTSLSHCGACGNACTGSNVCVAGACRPSNDRCASAAMLGTDPYNQTFTLSFRGATGEAGDCSGAGGSSVFYRVNLTRPALMYAMVQSNTIFTPTIGLSTDCVTARLCQTGACGDTRISHAYFQANPGPVFIEVGRPGGGDGDVTLVVSAIAIPATGSGASAMGAIAFDIGGPMYNLLNTFDPSVAQLQTSCGGATATPAFSLFWSSCPSAAAGAPLLMNTCTAERTFDTVLEYRDARGRTECNDDDTMTAACAPTGPGVGYGSTLNTMLSGGPNLHVVTLRQRSGAGLGTGRVRWRITDR